MAITKVKLSGSTDGRQIKVAATATAGTTIHTAHATNKDEVYLWATNRHTAVVSLTIEAGGTTSPNDLVTLSIPPNAGLTLVLPGNMPLTNSVVVGAFANVADVVLISGYVLRDDS